MTDLIAFASTLILLILMVNANEKLDLKKDASSNNEGLKHYPESLIKSDSENSAKPKLDILQEPRLLIDEAKSQTQENPMKHMKLLPESENVSKHDSPRHKVITSTTDNTHTEAVYTTSTSPSSVQNDSTLAVHNRDNRGNALNSTSVGTSANFQKKKLSENSAKPELDILQKPRLLMDEAKSQTQENPMKHMKLLPESENVSKHDSPRHKVTSATDNTHTEAADTSSTSPSLVRNDSTLAVHNRDNRGNTLNSTSVHSSASTKNVTNQTVSDVQPKKTNENTSLNVRASSSSIKNNSSIPETHVENSTISYGKMTILPFDIDELTTIITSMLFGNTESAVTNAYPEETLGVLVIEDENIDELDGETEANTKDVFDVGIIEDENIDGLDGTTDTNTERLLGIAVIEDAPESNTGLFIDPLVEEPLIEAITLETVDLEMTTIPANNSYWPIEKFDFLVFDENASVPCILLTMNISLSISYEMKDQKINTIEYQLPNEVIVSGQCGDRNSFMTISWVDSFLITKQNSITFNFLNDNWSFYVDSVNINISLDSHNFPNAKDAFISGNSSTNLKLFSAPVQNGIHICPTRTTIPCGKIVANIDNVAVFAFNKNQELISRKEEYCHITSNSIEEVNVGGIVGGIIGVVIALGVVAILCSWYRRRTDIKLRSELP